MDLDLAFQQANARILDYINRRWSDYFIKREQEKMWELYEETGIFPMYTSGCLTKQLNELHHLTQVLPKYPTLYAKYLEPKDNE